MNLNITTNTDIAAASVISDSNSEQKRQDPRHPRSFKQSDQQGTTPENAVSLELSAAARHLNAAKSNLANALAYLETQDAELLAVRRVLSRMLEIKSMGYGPCFDVEERRRDEMEFHALQGEVVRIASETIHGQALFSPYPMTVSMSDDQSIASMVQIEGIDLLGTGPGSSGQMAVVFSASNPASLERDALAASLEDISHYRMRNAESRKRVDVLMTMLSRNSETEEALSDTGLAEEHTHSASQGLLSRSDTPSLFQSGHVQHAVLNLIV